MRILLALLTIGVGAALIFSGYRLARFLIPFAGFLMGLTVGGAVISDMASTPFLGTMTGILVGLFFGALLAALAYAYYYIAVVVLAAGIGYWLGSGFITMLGLEPGALSAILGAAVGLFAGFLAVMSNTPKYTLIVLTSIAGAVAAVGGVMLMFNVVPLEIFSYTTASFAIRNSFFWSLLALVAIGFGIFAQIKTTPNTYELQKWGTDDDGGQGHTPHARHMQGA